MRYVVMLWTGLLTTLFSSNVIACELIEAETTLLQKAVKCPQSPHLAYTALIEMIQQGQFDEANALLAKLPNTTIRHPLINALLPLLKQAQPFESLTLLVKYKLTQLQKQYQPPSFELSEPVFNVVEPPESIQRGEFETSETFVARIEQAQQEYMFEIEHQQTEYQHQVQKYNEAVNKHNRSVKSGWQAHIANVQQQKTDYVNQAFHTLFGQPELSEPYYNADNQTFSAMLLSSNQLLQYIVEISVPIEEARQFKSTYQQVKPKIEWTLSQEQLRLSALVFELGENDYRAALTNNMSLAKTDANSFSFDAIDITPPIGLAQLDPYEYILSQDIDDFSVELQNDPELNQIKLQQKRITERHLIALKQKYRQKQIDAAQKVLSQQQRAYQQLIAETDEGMSQTVLDLIDNLPDVNQQHANKIAVIIGNKNYQLFSNDIPNVDYAINDALLIKQYFIKTLGIPENNILYIQDAKQSDLVSLFGTRGNHRGKLFSMLPQNAEVYVYYSGHGVPSWQNDQQYLLPVDAKPETIELNGYALSTLYDNLNQLPTEFVTVMLESCFSGQSHAGRVLNAASPVILKPKSQQTRLTNGLLMTASGADQVASWDTDARLGLFTRYFIEGVLGPADNLSYGRKDGKVTSDEIRNYLATHVSAQARQRFNRQQNPTVVTSKSRIMANLVE